MSVVSKRLIFTQQISFFEYSENAVDEVLNDLKGSPKWAWILHDKDVDENNVLKPPHLHIWLEYDDKKNSSALCNEVKDFFHIQESCIEYARSKIGCLGYLTHSTKKSANKYQYERDLIRSNFDFDEEVKAENIKINPVLQDIYSRIESKEINEWNLEQKLDMATCVKFEREIKGAFTYMKKRYGMGADKNMQVMYIWGDSGTGKTTLAKWFAEKNEMSVFVSSSSNDILDGYRGEECIILDDLRADNMRLEEFLKMADNHTNSSVRSRYQNKSIGTCKMLIITCCKPLEMFYKDFENTKFEQSKQFFRRITMQIQIVKSSVENVNGVDEMVLFLINHSNPRQYLNIRIPLPKVEGSDALNQFFSQFAVSSLPSSLGIVAPDGVKVNQIDEPFDNQF